MFGRNASTNLNRNQNTSSNPRQQQNTNRTNTRSNSSSRIEFTDNNGNRFFLNEISSNPFGPNAQGFMQINSNEPNYQEYLNNSRTPWNPNQRAIGTIQIPENPLLMNSNNNTTRLRTNSNDFQFSQESSSGNSQPNPTISGPTNSFFTLNSTPNMINQSRQRVNIPQNTNQGQNTTRTNNRRNNNNSNSSFFRIIPRDQMTPGIIQISPNSNPQNANRSIRIVNMPEEGTNQRLRNRNIIRSFPNMPLASLFFGSIPLSQESNSPNGTRQRTDSMVLHSNQISMGLFGPIAELENEVKFYKEAMKEYRAKNFQKAIVYFKKAFIEKPLAVTKANIALCYKHCKLINDSLQNIEVAIEMDDSKDTYFRFKGQLLFDIFKNSHEEEIGIQALESFQIAQELNFSKQNKFNYLVMRKALFFFKLADIKKEEEDLIKYLCDSSTTPAILNSENNVVANETDPQVHLSEENVKFYLKYKGDNKNKKKNFYSNQIPSFFNDVISMEPLENPVVTPSGNTYEKKSIIQHCRTSGCTDPITRKNFDSTDNLIPNKTLERAIYQFYLKNPTAFQEDLNDQEDPEFWKFAQFN